MRRRSHVDGRGMVGDQALDGRWEMKL